MLSDFHVHLVRHVPVINPRQIWYGKDVEIDTTSDQVRKYFNQLAHALPHDPERSIWRSSPYQRALATAEAVASEIKQQGGTHPEIIQDAGFVEQQYGVMEGMTHDDVKNCADAADYLADMWNNPPLGGESMQMLQARIAKALDNLKDNASKTCTDAVVFAHGGVIMAAYAHARKQRMIDVFKDRKALLTPSFSYVSCLTISHDRQGGEWVWKDMYIKGIGKGPA